MSEREGTAAGGPGEAPEKASPAEAGQATAGSERLVSWPPPDLSRIQGEIWGLVSLGGLGANLMVFPLLWSVAMEHPFWSLGPYGDAWYIPTLTSLFGLLLVLVAMAGLFRFLGRAAGATELGYGRTTLLEVATDLTRDTGFLIQGVRQYSTLDVSTRNRLIGNRIVGGLCYLFAAIWVCLGFTLSVLLAARDAATPPRGAGSIRCARPANGSTSTRRRPRTPCRGSATPGSSPPSSTASSSAAARWWR